MLPVTIEQTRARLTNQPGQNLARQLARAQDRDGRHTLNVLSDETAVRLTADSLQMIVAHAFGINENIGGEQSQEPAPRRVEKPCVRAELLELAHHRRFTKERRIQTTDYLAQES